MTKLTLYLFMGYPGAGKTTVAKLIHQETGAVHLWADHERRDMFETVTHSQHESLELYNRLNQRTEQLLAAGQSVIFDTNFNYRRDRDYLRQIAARHGAEVVVIWMVTPKDVARQRATHDLHREQNRYHQTMSEGEFEKLSNHQEEPGKDENFIKIDGTELDKQEAMRQLSLS